VPGLNLLFMCLEEEMRKRVVVALATAATRPWLKLTIDPNANYKTTATTFGPFAWQRMPQPQL